MITNYRTKLNYIKKKVDLLVVIDDFYNRKHNCDILINYNDLNLKQKKLLSLIINNHP